MNKSWLLLCIWLSDTVVEEAVIFAASALSPARCPGPGCSITSAYIPVPGTPSHPQQKHTFGVRQCDGWFFWSLINCTQPTRVPDLAHRDPAASHGRHTHTHILMAVSGKTILSSEMVIVSPRALRVREKPNICLKCCFVCIQGHFH